MQTSKIGLVQFGILSDLDILQLSVVEVHTPSAKSFENAEDFKQDVGGKRTKTRENTPYDERMGVLEEGKRCITCGEGADKCPGHFGHIVLPFPIYSLQFIHTTAKILQCICPFCARPRILPEHANVKELLVYKKKSRLTLLSKECLKVRICPWSDCGKYMPQYDLSSNKMFIKTFYQKKGRKNSEAKEVEFTEVECLNIFRRISNEHVNFLGFNEGLFNVDKFKDSSHFVSGNRFHAHQFRPEGLIFTILPVIPPTSRPYTIRDGKICDDDLTEGYNNIIKKKNQFLKLKSKAKPRTRQKLISLIKTYLWTLIDNTREGCKLSNGGRPTKCIKQRIKGKDGRVQNNVGGKRTDQSARTVIIPGGIALEADQVGIPYPIAVGLTHKEHVIRYNISDLQELVEKGDVKRVIRGENIIRLDSNIYDGKLFRLKIGDIVERVLKDDDYTDQIIFNRQPTLRVESMCGLRVKIINGYACRLPLCLTTQFGADFDGDNVCIKNE